VSTTLNAGIKLVRVFQSAGGFVTIPRLLTTIFFTEDEGLWKALCGSGT